MTTASSPWQSPKSFARAYRHHIIPPPILTSSSAPSQTNIAYSHSHPLISLHFSTPSITVSGIFFARSFRQVIFSLSTIFHHTSLSPLPFDHQPGQPLTVLTISSHPLNPSTVFLCGHVSLSLPARLSFTLKDVCLQPFALFFPLNHPCTSFSLTHSRPFTDSILHLTHLLLSLSHWYLSPARTRAQLNFQTLPCLDSTYRPDSVLWQRYVLLSTAHLFLVLSIYVLTGLPPTTKVPYANAPSRPSLM